MPTRSLAPVYGVSYRVVALGGRVKSPTSRKNVGSVVGDRISFLQGKLRFRHELKRKTFSAASGRSYGLRSDAPAVQLSSTVPRMPQQATSAQSSPRSCLQPGYVQKWYCGLRVNMASRVQKPPTANSPRIRPSAMGRTVR